jgi:hypothetical protein
VQPPSSSRERRGGGTTASRQLQSHCLGRVARSGAEQSRVTLLGRFRRERHEPLEHCTATDDGRACALEYNVVRWGRTDLPPEAGIAVYVRGTTGKLAIARIYDDSDPPLSSEP